MYQLQSTSYVFKVISDYNFLTHFFYRDTMRNITFFQTTKFNVLYDEINRETFLHIISIQK